MSTYTADVLQRLYAELFARKSEEQIDDILASFALRNCMERVEMTSAIRTAARRRSGHSMTGDSRGPEKQRTYARSAGGM